MSARPIDPSIVADRSAKVADRSAIARVSASGDAAPPRTHAKPRQPLTRRSAMRRVAAAGLTYCGLPAPLSSIARAATGASKRILLRSSWQTVNIGDIAHTPGVLAMLGTHLPDVEVTLWPTRIDNGVRELLLERFPNLRIADTPQSLQQAFEECDFLLHGSGASLVAESDVIRWSESTGKPYGVYAITLPEKKSSSTTATSSKAFARTIDVLSGASFVYFRDSVSLQLARSKGCTCPVMEFAPDGAFACDLRDEARAERFLAQNGLQAGEFLCCIPRLRYTPYWTIPEKKAAFDPVKHARNEELKEHDHAQLRGAIVEVVRQTDRRILICPEDQTQMEVGRQLLYEPLPDDVKRRVVWRATYWLTGEAISTYVRSAGLFGNEMHSPIMCIGHGIPAIVCRWEEQTSKGLMWRDIGLDQWLFDLDDPQQVEKIIPAVLDIALRPQSARRVAAQALAVVEARQRAAMQQLAAVLA